MIIRWCGGCTELLLSEDNLPYVIHPIYLPLIPPTNPDLSLIPSNPQFGQKLKKLHFLINSSDGNDIFFKKL